MTKAKRFLSAVMAVVMVMTMLSCLGVVANAYMHDYASLGSKWASETTPGGPGYAKTYSQLATLFGDVSDNSQHAWVYYAIEAYENVAELEDLGLDDTIDYDNAFEDEDGELWTLTDHYVQPDQNILFIQYQKGNCYGGTWYIATEWDRLFFDVLTPSNSAKRYAATNDPMGHNVPTGNYPKTKTTPASFGGQFNPDNPYWEQLNELQMSCDRGNSYAQTKLTNNKVACGISTDITYNWDCLYYYLDAGLDDTSNAPLFTDEFLLSYKLKVRSDAEPKYTSGNTPTGTFNPVPDGTVGHIGIDNNLSKIKLPTRNAMVMYVDIGTQKCDDMGDHDYMDAMNLGKSCPPLLEYTIADATADMQNNANNTTGYYFTEDCNHTFIIGDAPAPGAGFSAKFFDGASEYTSLAISDATTITLPAAQTKTGFTFGGWSDGTTTYQPGASYTLTADTNFTAVWNEITYSIKYFDGQSEYTTLAQSATYTNNSITLPAAQTKSGFRFDGWSDGTSTYQPGASYTVTGDTNFQAVWTQLYTATFVDEDSTSYGSATLAAGDAIPFPTVTPRDGYTYAWDPALTAMPASDTTFTLRWTAAGSSINFETNGGTPVEPITGAYGDPVSAPADPTKTGYTFAGWYADPDFQTAYSFTVIPATAVTVYAKWTANSYNADFYITGESIPYDTVPADYGTSFTAPALPTEEGYSFSPWNPSDFVMNAEGRSYYTTKTANSYTITFKDADGIVITSDSQTYGNTLEIPNPPVVAGQTFSGWTGDDGSFINAGATGTMVPARNTVYTATYGVDTYTITYKVNDVVVHTDTLAYNAVVIPYNYEAPTGQEFSGWSNLPTRMPANDVVVTGTTTLVDYTITYLDYTGGVFATFTAHYGDAMPAPTTQPTAPGMQFVDWDNDAETVTGNAQISGLWNPMMYNIKFVYGLEGENEEAGGTAAYNSVIYSTSFPNEDAAVSGYSMKWQYNGTDVGSSFTVPALPADTTIVFTAVYGAQTYTIEYQVNGQRVGTQEYAFGAPIDNPRQLPYETGYDVSGWIGLPETMPAENIVVNCTKTPHVYTDTWYDYDGSVMTTTQVAYLETIEAPTFDPANYPGIQGLAWSPTPGTQAAEDMTFYLVGSGATVDVTVETYIMDLDGTTYVPAGTATIPGVTGRAVSVPTNMRSRTGFTLNTTASTLEGTTAGDGTTVLTVYFDRNEYAINVTDDATTYTVNYYYEAPVSDLTPAGKTGYTFDGWTWTRAANGASATQPATMPAYNLNAAAKYTVNKYSFVTYVDGVQNTTAQVTYDTVVNEPAALTKEGYTFDGWYTDDTYATKVTFPFNMPAEDVEVYARFNINTYTYTFDTAGGTAINPITAAYGSPINVANPEKEGYTFQTWNPSLPATMGAGDQTFTAIYKINKYTVSYRSGGANVKVVTADYGTALDSLAAPTVSQTGYTFTGWAYADGEGVAYNGTTVPAFNLAANAQFQVNSYAAVFYLDENDTGVYTELNDIEFGTTFTAPECNAQKEYYNFVGWTDGTNTYQPGDPIPMDAEGKTLTAVWQQDTSACRVESVERITDGYYQLGGALYEVTLVAGVSPETLIISTPNDGTFYLARMEYDLGRTTVIRKIETVGDKEVWTLYLTLEESRGNVYGASCEVDGVEDSPFMFGVTYDIKDAEAIAADFLSADISALEVVRGNALTWTVTTTTKVAWLKFVGTYTDGAGNEQELITYYKASNYRDGDGVETAKVTDAEGVRTWVIPMVFNYPGTEDKSVQTWNIEYRCTGSSVWETAVVSDGNGGYVTYASVVTVAKKAEVLVPVTNEDYEKYTLVSVSTDKANAVIGDTITFTVVTTDDVSKIRIGFVIVSTGTDNGKTKTATYQETSTNVKNIETANGLSTWTITFKVSKVAENGAFDVQCRGLSWGEAQTATVAISA